MSERPTLIDVLHELIAQETAQLREFGISTEDDRSKDKRKNDLVRMRRLSKRDAYYRVIHILRGYDTEFPLEKINEADKI